MAAAPAAVGSVALREPLRAIDGVGAGLTCAY